jgi:phage terminase small subunit
MEEVKQPRQVDEYRWRRFAEEYIIDFNGVRAYKECGCYNPKNDKLAERSVYDLLRKPVVQQYIQEAIAARSERTAVTGDKIVREYARLAFFNLKSVSSWDDNGFKLLPSDEVSEDDSATFLEPYSETEEFETEDKTIKKVKTRIKTHNKYPALEKLAAYVDLFGDRARGDAFIAEVGEGISRLLNYQAKRDDSGSDTGEDGSES